MKLRWIRIVAIVASILYVGTVAVMGVTWGTDAGATNTAVAEGPEGAGDPDAGPVIDEGRLRAFEAAQTLGIAGVPGPVKHVPTPGWSTSVPVSTTQDDWEPAVATDPNAPYVYLLVTRYGGGRACPTCPWVKLVLKVSSDGGQTFGPDQFLLPAPGGKNQYDPEIEVSSDGTVFAAFLQGYVPGVTFIKSTNHGATWTEPVTMPSNWSDKPVLAVAPNGQDIYIAFNGPTAGDGWIGQSHDGGATWTATNVMPIDRYTFAGGGYATNDGLVVFAENEFNQTYTGNVQTFVLVSTDAGATWRTVVVDVGSKQPDCTSKWCYDGFYGFVPAVTGNGIDDLLVAYARANKRGDNQRVYVKTSSDQGLHWSQAVRVSAPGAMAGSPAAVGAMASSAAAVGNGQDGFWVTYMDKSLGDWNTFARQSTDGGQTWSDPARISDATSGAPYLSKKGFVEVYGDYQEIAITNTGRTFVTWGASISYGGPGGIWYNYTTAGPS